MGGGHYRPGPGGRFYESGIFATLLLLAAELFFFKLEYRILHNAPEVNLYREYGGRTCPEKVLKLYRERNVKVLNLEITRSTGSEHHNACAIFTLWLNKQCKVEELLRIVTVTKGVVAVEEL